MHNSAEPQSSTSYFPKEETLQWDAGCLLLFPEEVSARGRWSVFWEGLTEFSLCVMRALGKIRFCPVHNNKGRSHTQLTEFMCFLEQNRSNVPLVSFFYFHNGPCSEIRCVPKGCHSHQRPGADRAPSRHNIFINQTHRAHRSASPWACGQPPVLADNCLNSSHKSCLSEDLSAFLH